MRPSPNCTSCMPTLFTRSSFPRKLPHPQAWQCSWWDTNPLVHDLELKQRHQWLQKYQIGMGDSTTREGRAYDQSWFEPANHETLQVMWDPSPHSKHMQKSLDIKLLAGAKWWVSVQLSLSRLCLLSFFFFNLSMVYPGLVFLDCFAMICSHCISHNPSLFF